MLCDMVLGGILLGTVALGRPEATMPQKHPGERPQPMPRGHVGEEAKRGQPRKCP